MKPKEWANFIILTLIWGASFLWIKIAVQEVGPFTIVAIRLTFAIIVLLGFIIAQKPGIPAKRYWFPFVLQGIISAALPWILITWAEKYIDSALATVLNGTVPMFTLLAAHFFLHDDRMNRWRVLGLAVGFLGVVVLMQRDLGAAEPTASAGTNKVLLAQIAMLCASLLYGLSNVYARAKFRDLPRLAQAFFPLVAADAIMWIVAPTVEAPFTLPALPITWVAIAWLGILGAGISYLMFYHLLHSIGPTRAAVVTYTIPVVGVTLGVVFLGERLDGALVAGMLLIVSGVWAVNKRPRQSRPL